MRLMDRDGMKSFKAPNRLKVKWISLFHIQAMWKMWFSFPPYWLFNFAVSNHIFSPFQLHLDFICECVCACVRLISGLTVNKHCLCDRNYEARSTDMSCYIIYISVTTMHFLNLDFWQMAFLFEMFFISLTLYPKLMCRHPVIFGLSCEGDEMNADRVLVFAFIFEK